MIIWLLNIFSNFVFCLQDDNIFLDDEKLVLEATALGANGRKHYSCNIAFYLTIDEEVSKIVCVP